MLGSPNFLTFPKYILDNLKTHFASIQAKKRKTSLQEGSLGSALSKMITLPLCMKRTFDENYQVDSSSWEFLNRNVEDDCASKNLNKEVTKDKNGKSENIYPRRKQYSSTDSLYESEFDSCCSSLSSTILSSNTNISN